MPPWPTRPVAYGPVVLRRFSDLDVPMVQEMSTDPYIPLIGTLPPNANQQEARDYIDFIEAEIEAPVTLVSTGPRREETIVRPHASLERLTSGRLGRVLEER